MLPRMADDLDDEEEEEQNRGPHGDMYVKYNVCLHGIRGENDNRPPPLSVPFMRKFFAHAKQVCRCACGLFGSLACLALVGFSAVGLAN